MRKLLGVILLSCLLSTTEASNASCVPTMLREYASIDGYGNNILNPQWGATHELFTRYSVPVTYADGFSELQSDLPSARTISLAVFNGSIYEGKEQPTAPKQTTNMATMFGQLIAHETGLASVNEPTLGAQQDPIPILVDACDYFMDPNCTGNVTLRMFRSGYRNTTGTGPGNPRMQVNELTAYMDGGAIYGNCTPRLNALREFVGGRMLTSRGYLGEELPPILAEFPVNPMGNIGIVNASYLYSAGDPRANENIQLLAMHTLFIREHNRIAARFAQENPLWCDEQIFWEARRYTTGVMNNIAYNEWLPALIGEFPAYPGYDPTVRSGVHTENHHAGLRGAHSQISSTVLRLKDDRSPIADGNTHMKDVFFNPTSLQNNTMDSLFIGMAEKGMLASDAFVVPDVQNMLFKLPGHRFGTDLVALNIQRGRDHGLPTFNNIRRELNLKPHTSFQDLSSVPSVVDGLSRMYTSIEQVEAFVGLLVEDTKKGSTFGETTSAMLTQDFQNHRVGDRFYFEHDYDAKDPLLVEIRSTTMATLILRNTNISYLQCSAFALPDGCWVGTGYPSATSPTAPMSNSSSVSHFVVTTMEKTISNPTYQVGNSIGFAINGTESPVLTLQRGQNYSFYLEHSCQQCFCFCNTSACQYLYTHNVVTLFDGLSPGQACSGATVYLAPDSTTPNVLYYEDQFSTNAGWRINIVDPIVPVVPVNPSTTGSIVGAGTTGTTGTTRAAGTTGAIFTGFITTASAAIASGASSALQEATARLRRNQIGFGVAVGVLGLLLLLTLAVLVIFVARRSNKPRMYQSESGTLSASPSTIQLIPIVASPPVTKLSPVYRSDSADQEEAAKAVVVPVPAPSQDSPSRALESNRRSQEIKRSQEVRRSLGSRENSISHSSEDVSLTPRRSRKQVDM